MKQDDPKKIHFLGIGGSGASAAAVLAKKNGFSVSGCNLDLQTPYLQKVKDHKIKLFEGHDKEHVEDAEVLATSPALFFSDQKIEELEYAKKAKRVVSWQKFVGEYLTKNKKVLSVSGTHGKSTTTAMIGLMMEQLGIDPTVLVGAKVPKWEANFRWGESEYFLIEADEFYNNFLNYKSDYIVINNIEFDHPDFFQNVNEVYESFNKFIDQIKGDKVLIVNQDSDGVIKLLESLSKTTRNKLKIFGYTLKERSKFDFVYLYKAKKIHIKNGTYSYSVALQKGQKINIDLNLPGKYNISNSLGAIALIDQLGYDLNQAVKALKNFSGVGRRLELISDKHGIMVYDDYAHHPSAIKVTLEALKEKYPKKSLLAIIEPHSFSRTKALLKEYYGIFRSADTIIVGPIFKARDESNMGINGENIVMESGHNNIRYIDTPQKLIEWIKDQKLKNCVIVVMGAGDSYKWARNIADLL